MKLEEQVPSLELSKKLEELDVKQESYFSYTEQEGYIGLEHWELRRATSGADIVCSAFTVAELGEMLPYYVVTSHRSSEWACFVPEDFYRFMKFIKEEFTGKTEADARAKMLIYLLENGLVKV